MQARFELPTVASQLGEWVTHMRGTNPLSPEEPSMHQASQTILTYQGLVNVTPHLSPLPYPATMTTITSVEETIACLVQE